MTAQWGDITAKEMLSPIHGVLVSGRGETVFSGISTDSRTTLPGEVFCALVGDNFDGHDFVQKAVDKGASGVIIQNNHRTALAGIPHAAVITVDDTLAALGDLARWWRHQYNVRVVAITGSAGKTSTKEMTAEILKLDGPTLVSQGNFNNLIGLPLTLLRLGKEHKNAVLEMGMNRPGEIDRLTWIADPDVGVITNVGMAHTEGVGDIQGVADAKTEMIGRISPRSQVVLNGDNTVLMKTAAKFHREYVTFGFDQKNKIHCSELQNLGKDGTRFHLHCGDGSHVVDLVVPGMQHVANALAAAAACACLDIELHHIVEGLRRFGGMKGRFSLLSISGNITVVDDTYNANPLSLKAALESVAAMVEQSGRMIVGLGEMMELGSGSSRAHRQAGQMVAMADAAYFVAIGEHAGEMLAGAMEKGMSTDNAVIATSVHEMAESIQAHMKPGDLILLKGSRRIHLEKVLDALRECK